MSVIEAVRLERTLRLLVTGSACVCAREASVPTPEGEGFAGMPELADRGDEWAKRMEEYVADAYRAEYGLDVCVARPVNAYGPRDDFEPDTSHVIPALIRRVVGGETAVVVWGDGAATRSFLFGDDVVRGLMVMAERAEHAGGDQHRDRRGSIDRGSRVPHRAAEWTADERGLRSVEAHGHGPAEAALRRLSGARALGCKAEVPLEDGLARTVAWYRATAS